MNAKAGGVFTSRIDKWGLGSNQVLTQVQVRTPKCMDMGTYRRFLLGVARHSEYS